MILVTSANGRVGRLVIEALVKEGFAIRAIDINPLYNPCVYVKSGRVSPPAGAIYADRSADFPHKIDKNDLAYKGNADVKLRVKSTDLPDGDIPVTVYYINDDCNWFDEWEQDRQAAGITDDQYSWSPDDGNLSIKDQAGWDLFYGNIDKYYKCAALEPVTEYANVKNGTVTLDLTLDANSVAFVAF